ncbi:hypothetical protein EYC84_004499 [Monilinia fructicola]|uniref:Uncharacterized protein n=1 Tax=Monilinia fructicola TaxID=38448 RepID=A0A5M9K3F8_MONFR|nr:hypothetical protein EYC84_004499 [Monilinia fructicola]
MGGNISARGHDNVRFYTLVVGGPIPDSETLFAVGKSIFQVEELEMVLLVGDNDVDIIGAAETVVHAGEKTVFHRVGGKCVRLQGSCWRRHRGILDLDG